MHLFGWGNQYPFLRLFSHNRCKFSKNTTTIIMRQIFEFFEHRCHQIRSRFMWMWYIFNCLITTLYLSKAFLSLRKLYSIIFIRLLKKRNRFRKYLLQCWTKFHVATDSPLKHLSMYTGNLNCRTKFLSNN